MCIEVTFLGTGSSAHPRRAQSSLLISLDDNLKIIVDMGCSSYNYLRRLGFTSSDIDLFLFTHTHYDHICGLPLMLFSESFKKKPSIKVATDIMTWSNIKSLVEVLVKTGIKFKPEIRPVAFSPSTMRLSNDVLIELFPVRHTVEAYGVTIKYKDVRLVVSGDTAPVDLIRRKARSATLLIHEATLPAEASEEEELREGHTTVSNAIKFIMSAERGFLYHLSERSEEDALKLSAPHRGKVLVPEDLLSIKIC